MGASGAAIPEPGRGRYFFFSAAFSPAFSPAGAFSALAAALGASSPSSSFSLIISTSPAATPASAAATAADAGGTVYGLPTLIRVFSGERLIGTDLTTLQMIVRSGGTEAEAYLTPFCVN